MCILYYIYITHIYTSGICVLSCCCHHDGPRVHGGAYRAGMLEWEARRLAGGQQRTALEAARFRVGRLRLLWAEWASWGAPVVGQVSSAALAFVHEIVAIDPAVRVVVLTRPRDEVVALFMRKTGKRNHWERDAGRLWGGRGGRRRRQQQTCAVSVDVALPSAAYSIYYIYCISVTGRSYRCVCRSGTGCCYEPDKKWDVVFPNMDEDPVYAARIFSAAELAAGSEENLAKSQEASKRAAVESYCDFYERVTAQLEIQYPSNVRRAVHSLSCLHNIIYILWSDQIGYPREWLL
jgi:hypothetical protein